MYKILTLGGTARYLVNTKEDRRIAVLNSDGSIGMYMRNHVSIGTYYPSIELTLWSLIKFNPEHIVHKPSTAFLKDHLRKAALQLVSEN